MSLPYARSGCGPRALVVPDTEDEYREVIENTQRLIDNIEYINQWGIDRNIVRGQVTALTQIKKLKDEIKELETALYENDEIEIIDGIGDVFTVLIQIARITQVTLDEATDRAYSQIRYRKGKMIDGVFVKEGDVA